MTSARRSGLALAVLAYLPALIAAPGRMPSDSKLYLYLDPGRFLADAATTFDPRQFAGWVPHQHVSYLWPAGPWFWLFESIGVPDWFAHRLWIGTLIVAAGLGVRWCARTLGLGELAAVVAAVAYQLGPYLLPYVSRTSVMLLPWAGLGWIVGCTVRATRRASWRDPALIALIVFTVGAVNATALAMVIPAPALWLVHALWQRSLAWRAAGMVVVRVALLTVPVCAWWIVMLAIQGRSGADVLPYSETLADVSLTATAPEVWRGLGYWLFYIRDDYAAATSASLRYLQSTPAIVVSYALPILALVALVGVRWSHRRFAALLVAAGAVLSVGVHPVEDRSPLMRLVTGDGEGGLALALRSSTRALPLISLGVALLLGAGVSALGARRLPRLGWQAGHVAAAVIVLLVAVNLPSAWNGGFVDPALERDQQAPTAWRQAAAALDASGAAGRVLQLPGAEFGAFRWGYTVDQPLPGLTDKPLVTRDLLPLGSPAAMDLLYALDDRIQDGVFESAALAPVARWLGVDTVWVAGDLAFDRFRTARPQIVADEVASAPGIGAGKPFGRIGLNTPAVAMSDEQALSDRRATAPITPVTLHELDQPGRVVRAPSSSVVVSGSGDGLVDLAAAGLLDGSHAVRYSAAVADPGELDAALSEASALLVTDSNRDRDRHWRGSQDTLGATESDQPELESLDDVPDQRLPVFAERGDAVDPVTQTVARQIGPVRVTANAYGEPFAYLPEHRPYAAIDGDPTTVWLVGEHADPIGATLRVILDEPLAQIGLRQHDTKGGRLISEVTLIGIGPVVLDARSLAPEGQPIELPAGTTNVDIEITGVGGGTPFTPGAAAAVGIVELVTGLPATREVVRVPSDALARVDDATPLALAFTRLRTDPLDRWRDDPETELIRQFDLPAERSFDVSVDVRVDARTDDAALAAEFGWPAFGSTRLVGSLASTGVAAVDGDVATAWTTAFDQALGATLTIDAAQLGLTGTFDALTLVQPVGTTARIVEIAVRSGGEERRLELAPDASGAARVTFAPLPAGSVEIVILAADGRTTSDRRFGDVVALPAAISEIAIDGMSAAEPLAATEHTWDCLAVLDVDGTPLTARLTVSGQELLAGATAQVEPCTTSLTLAGGSHVLASSPELEKRSLQLDRVVLTDLGAAELGDAPQATATVVDSGRFARDVRVDVCPDGCWLVLGEGFNTAWSASLDGESLGPPQLIDGGFNGWRLAGAPDARTIELRWQRQGRLLVAFAVTLAGVLAALALAFVPAIVRRRPTPVDTGAADEHATAPPSEVPSPVDLTHSIDRRRAVIAAVAWPVLAGLLIATEWALWGLVAGVASFVWRRARLAELVALGAVVGVALMVTVDERRFAPLPNGAWPAAFERWHAVAMFAFVAVVVAAISADDASYAGADDDSAASVANASSSNQSSTAGASSGLT